MNWVDSKIRRKGVSMPGQQRAYPIWYQTDKKKENDKGKETRRR